MRKFLLFGLMIALVGSAAATDLGTVQRVLKTNDHVGMNPGTPDGRQGGEDVATAVVIAALPFSDTGNTSDNVHDYDAVCPYSGSTSPDVVYSFAPAYDVVISVDLCGSGYDTKTYVLDSTLNVVACNDDAYFDATCGNYVSFIEDAYLTGGETYYIVIDGYGGEGGDYILAVEEFEAPPPCVINCNGDYVENEPALVDGYVDAYNGGCNSPEFGNPILLLNDDGPCGGLEDMTFCGTSGWFVTAEGGNSRDTDWLSFYIGVTGVVQWTLNAEQESYGFLLGPQDCGTVGVIDQILVGPCAPLTMTIQGAPLDLVWIWVGPSVFEAPGGFVGNEYNYQCDLDGLWATPGVTPTDKTTLGAIKCLYR